MYQEQIFKIHIIDQVKLLLAESAEFRKLLSANKSTDKAIARFPDAYIHKLTSAAMTETPYSGAIQHWRGDSAAVSTYITSITKAVHTAFEKTPLELSDDRLPVPRGL